MLSRLEIEGLAIIESLTIEFSPRFNVITGETGAGKSILIRALGLLLGAKGHPETVRSGRSAATVSGFFEVEGGHRVLGILSQFGIPYEPQPIDNGVIPILMRRVVNAKGRSFAWINDVPVTAGALKEAGSALIDVFGQHDSLRLLDPGHHLQWVDQFLPLVAPPPLGKAVLEDYAVLRKKISAELNEFFDLIDRVRNRRQGADYISFRCEELARFQPQAEEYHHIAKALKAATQNLQILRDLQIIQSSLEAEDQQASPGQKLWDCHRRLNRMTSSPLDETTYQKLTGCTEQAAQIAGSIDDLSFNIGVMIRDLSVNENELEDMQLRLVGYQDLFRKLNVTSIDQLMTEHTRLIQERVWIDQASQTIEAALHNLHANTKKLKILGESLTKARLKAKEIVKKNLETELHQLAMPGAKIDFEFTTLRQLPPELSLAFISEDLEGQWQTFCDDWSMLGEHGMEKGQFLLASNLGEPFHPLQKIASGGEISRVILALKKSLAAGADSCLLVFDEIDTGISGRIADVVGQKIQELSKRFQVICISHLAQVTAYADAHFLVRKQGKGVRIESQIIPLDKKTSEREIARLISGAEVTPASLNHAKQLLKKAKERDRNRDFGKPSSFL